MKVYVLEGQWDYEGFKILGVFSSMELAKAAEINARDPDGLHYRFFDDWTIEEFDVIESHVLDVKSHP